LYFSNHVIVPRTPGSQPDSAGLCSSIIHQGFLATFNCSAKPTLPTLSPLLQWQQGPPILQVRIGAKLSLSTSAAIRSKAHHNRLAVCVCPKNSAAVLEWKNMYNMCRQWLINFYILPTLQLGLHMTLLGLWARLQILWQQHQLQLSQLQHLWQQPPLQATQRQLPPTIPLTIHAHYKHM
jgi:hypothetical protein